MKTIIGFCYYGWCSDNIDHFPPKLTNKTPTKSKFKFESATLDNRHQLRSLLQLKRFSNRKLTGTSASRENRNVEQQLEMLKHSRKTKRSKSKTLWRNGIEEVLMDLSKVKNLFSLAQQKRDVA